MIVSSDDLDERTRPTNFERKIMIVIFIGINGLALLDFVPNGQFLNSDRPYKGRKKDGFYIILQYGVIYYDSNVIY